MITPALAIWGYDAETRVAERNHIGCMGRVVRRWPALPEAA